jgi:hypothetical protein
MSQVTIDGSLFESSGTPGKAVPFISAAYPRHYIWVAVVALLDILITILVLSTGGNELNALARWAIEHAGHFGLVAVKGLTLAVVLCICEYLGRHRPRAGLRIAEFALISNSVAVAFGLVYLGQYTFVLLQWI